MIRRDTDYAFRSLVHIAMSPSKAATAGELAKAQDVPVGFAQKILRKLARAGILEAKQGRGGGFVLTKAPGKVSLMQVVTLLQGPLLLNRCMGDPKACRRQPTCPVSLHLRKVQDGLNDFFESTTLADVLVAPGSRPGHVAAPQRRGRRSP